MKKWAGTERRNHSPVCPLVQSGEPLAPEVCATSFEEMGGTPIEHIAVQYT